MTEHRPARRVGRREPVARQWRRAAVTVAVAAVACLAATVIAVSVASNSGSHLDAGAAVLIVLIAAAGTITSVLGVWRLGSGIVVPIDDLHAAVRRIAAGEADVRIPRSGAADVQQVATEVETLSRLLSDERRQRTRESAVAERRASTVRQLLRLTQGVGGSLDVDRVLAETGKAAMTITGHPVAIVWSNADVEGRLRAVWDSRRPSEPPTLDPVRFGEGWVGRAASTGQIVTTRTERGDADGLAVPLVLGLTILGVIETQGGAAIESHPDDFEALEVLARHAATAIEAAQLHEEVEKRSETDGLTRVLNRRRLDTDLRIEVARSIRYARPLALAMVDVDHFKAINDTFGHPQGDEVLKCVAATLQRECRETDGAYRFGGEEFAVLLRDTDTAWAEAVADRFRVRIQEGVRALGLPREVTASLGVAAVGGTVDSAERLVEAADAALYEAKRSGRNRVVLHTPGPPPAGLPSHAPRRDTGS